MVVMNAASLITHGTAIIFTATWFYFSCKDIQITMHTRCDVISHSGISRTYRRCPMDISVPTFSPMFPGYGSA